MVSSKDIKTSIIISACDNREIMFRRSLDTWARQTVETKSFEIVIVDDACRKDFEILCKEYNEKYNINFQYIRIDNSKSITPVKTFIPVLSNNIGIKNAKG